MAPLPWGYPLLAVYVPLSLIVAASSLLAMQMPWWVIIPVAAAGLAMLPGTVRWYYRRTEADPNCKPVVRRARK